jgi:hypothetical protein
MEKNFFTDKRKLCEKITEVSRIIPSHDCLQAARRVPWRKRNREKGIFGSLLRI